MSTNQHTEENEWQRVWDARIAALTPILGRPADNIYHSPVPMYLGGFADVLQFPHYVPGMSYVTADLTGPDMRYLSADLNGEDVGQLPNSLGNYELMICVHEELSRAAHMVSRLARYTCDAVLEAGDSMDLDDFFTGSVIKALLFTHPAEQPVQFEFLGHRYGLLLCIGITSEELAFMRASGSDELLALLTRRGIFPYTVLQRDTVVP